MIAFQEGPIARELRGSSDWRLVKKVMFLADDSVGINVFERRFDLAHRAASAASRR